MAKFLSKRDFEFFQHINREMAADVLDTIVLLFKLNLNYTNMNIYGESLEKVSFDAVELPVFIKYGKTEVRSEKDFGINMEQTVNFGFVRRILRDRNVYPEVGDIIQYNDLFYEINNTQEVQLIAGRPEYNHSIICESHLTRRTDLQLTARQI